MRLNGWQRIGIVASVIWAIGAPIYMDNGAALTAPRLRTLHRAEDIGSALQGGVNVCHRHLVNEVLGPFVTEFVRNFGCEGATPIQLGSNASLLGTVQVVKVIQHVRSDRLRAAPWPPLVAC
jgi:hypothetical protein